MALVKGKCLENVDRTHLVLASDKLVQQKKLLATDLNNLVLKPSRS